MSGNRQDKFNALLNKNKKIGRIKESASRRLYKLFDVLDNIHYFNTYGGSEISALNSRLQTPLDVYGINTDIKNNMDINIIAFKHMRQLETILAIKNGKYLEEKTFLDNEFYTFNDALNELIRFTGIRFIFHDDRLSLFRRGFIKLIPGDLIIAEHNEEISITKIKNIVVSGKTLNRFMSDLIFILVQASSSLHGRLMIDKTVFVGFKGTMKLSKTTHTDYVKKIYASHIVDGFYKMTILPKEITKKYLKIKKIHKTGIVYIVNINGIEIEFYTNNSTGNKRVLFKYDSFREFEILFDTAIRYVDSRKYDKLFIALEAEELGLGKILYERIASQTRSDPENKHMLKSIAGWSNQDYLELRDKNKKIIIEQIKNNTINISNKLGIKKVLIREGFIKGDING